MRLSLTWGGRFLAAFASNRAPGKSDDDDLKRRAQPWQDRAFIYYNSLGEIWYSAQFYAKMMSRLELKVQELKAPEVLEGEEGSQTEGDAGDTDLPAEPEWLDTDNQAAIDALERVKDRKGGREHLQASYGRLRFLTGETFLIVTLSEEGDERWECVSMRELKPLNGGKQWERNFDGANDKRQYNRLDPNATAMLEDDIQVYRLWAEHPEFSALADGPMRGILDQCEELLLLDRAVRGRTRSRIASSGLLLVPSQISPPPRTNSTGEAARQDKFLNTLIDHMESPIANEGTASSVVPLLIRGDAQYLKELRHIDLGIGSADKSVPEVALRDKCVERIALGLDMPPEVLLGVTDANHWTAWQISEAEWTAHGEPVAIDMVNDFTNAFFRPALALEASLDPTKFRIWFDASGVVNHPDRGADANTGYELMLLSGEAWRAAHGFESADAPKIEELYKRIAMRYGDLGLLENGNPEESTGALSAPGKSPTDSSNGPDNGPDDGDQAPPSDGQPAESAPGDGDEAKASLDLVRLDARIIAAADLMMFRARQLAGSRLRTSLRKAKTEGAWAGVSNIDLCYQYAKAGNTIDPDVLCTGSGAEFLSILVDRLGIPFVIAEQVVTGAEQWAAATLKDEDPGPVPDYVRGRIEVAAALVPD